MHHTRNKPKKPKKPKEHAAVALALLIAAVAGFGCRDASPPATEPAAKTNALTKEQHHWLAAWSRGDKGKRPAWAGGTEVLRWPEDLPDNIMRSWAKDKGLSDLSESEITTRLGRPVRTLANPSVGSRLLLYRDGGIELIAGKCTGWSPRSPNFEKYFVQPDL